MSLGKLFVLIPGLCYLGEACVCAWQKNWPMVTVYAGYALANCGLIIIAE